MPMRCCALAVLLLVLTASASAQQGYYREPALHYDVLVFVAEGDLWRVDASGGAAARLTTHPGQERMPVISPDGATVAFIAHYEGSPEVYTMPLAGGRPTRRTYGAESGVRVCGFAPDGRLLFASTRESTLPNLQLFALDPVSGAVERLPLFEASHGALGRDGRTLFFTRFRHRQHCKRYVGGLAEQLWRFELGSDNEAVPLTADWNGTSHRAMIWGDRVVVISDRDGTRNLWSMDRDGKALRQHTHHVGFDVLEASLWDGRVAYRVGADLHVLDLATGSETRIDVTLQSDFDQTRERWIEDAMSRLGSAHLSPNGDRVVLTARGQAFVAHTDKALRGVVTLSRAADVRYREARFLPGSDRVLALSDESDETEFWKVAADGRALREQLTKNAVILRSGSKPSPDGKWLAWTDKAADLWVYEFATGEERLVDDGAEWLGDLTWSADGRWLAWVRSDGRGLAHIRVHEPASQKSLDATSPRFASGNPAFSPDGKWLWFTSMRDFKSRVGSPWGSFQPEPYFESKPGIYAVALVAGERFPFTPPDQPEPDDESAAKPDDAKDDAPAPPTHSLPERVAALYRAPIDTDRFSWLAVVDDALLVLIRGDDGAALHRLALSPKVEEPAELATEVRGVELSADRKRLLVRTGKGLHVISANAKSMEQKAFAKAAVDLGGWRIKLSPREDWRQIFLDSWRMHRDYFYDPGMHGVDWPAMRAKYLPLVARVGDRDELNDLIGQMIGELSALHSRARGGDQRSGPEDVANASLGARIEADPAAARWRIAHIYRADPERPELRAPLARPDLGLNDGDGILSIDGVAYRSGLSFASLLREKAGQPVNLVVKPVDGVERTVRIEPITLRAESNLRYHEWEFSRRRRVEERGEGKLAYIHLRAMGRRDIGDWVREYAPIFERQGLVVDVRHNDGGNIDSWILGRLLRKAWSYWKPAQSRPSWNMQRAFRGHLVVLCDHATASDGEAFAEGFRRLGLGQVIGTRTWGGEIWLGSRNRTVDGGLASAGEDGVYGPDGTWLIEGRGVEPDVVVDNLPHATFLGADAQLDAAIAHLQKRIAADPRPVPAPPAHPDKSSPDNRRRTGADNGDK